MKRYNLPLYLTIWMDERGFDWTNKNSPHYLTEDEIFSAACELLDDMHEYGNKWNEYDPSSIARFVRREFKTHERLELSAWYGKGC